MVFGPGWLFKREDQISLFPRETKVLSPPAAAVQRRRADRCGTKQSGRPAGRAAVS